MLGYPGHAVIGELGSEGAKLHWPSLIMFLCLLVTIWLLLVLTSLSLPDWSRLPLRQSWPSGRPAVLCRWLEQASWETDQTLELVVVGGPIYQECRCRYRPGGWWKSGQVGEMLCLQVPGDVPADVGIVVGVSLISVLEQTSWETGRAVG